MNLNNLFIPTVIDWNKENSYWSEIIPGFLYLGNEGSARDKTFLKEKGITHIINAAKEVPNYYPLEYIYPPDGFSFLDTTGEDLFPRFPVSWNMIDQAINTNGKVLVHCKAGISRSASLVIAYLMRTYGFNFIQAYSFVKSKRSIIQPNTSFNYQLFILEQILAKKKAQQKIQSANSTVNVNGYQGVNGYQNANTNTNGYQCVNANGYQGVNASGYQGVNVNANSNGYQGVNGYQYQHQYQNQNQNQNQNATSVNPSNYNYSYKRQL